MKQVEDSAKGQQPAEEVDEKWKKYRIARAVGPKASGPEVQGMGKLSDSGKPEGPRSASHGEPLTVPIHREDPQAGYYPVTPDTVQNGTVPPNPKDAREDAQMKAQNNAE
ncbi:MAG: hypothetical protein K9J06_06265 [Flavobacteriales bacterium]|nr:hypothetical protein [Flavobacteriales bacterium]